MVQPRGQGLGSIGNLTPSQMNTRSKQSATADAREPDRMAVPGGADART